MNLNFKDFSTFLYGNFSLEPKTHTKQTKICYCKLYRIFETAAFIAKKLE